MPSESYQDPEGCKGANPQVIKNKYYLFIMWMNVFIESRFIYSPHNHQVVFVAGICCTQEDLYYGQINGGEVELDPNWKFKLNRGLNK